MSSVSFSYQRAVLLAAHHAQILESNDQLWRQRFERQAQRVSLTEQDTLWAQIANSPNVQQFLPALAKTIEPSELDILGYAAASANTLAEAISLIQRYYPLIGDGGDLFVMHTGKLLALEYFPRYQVAKQLRVESVLTCILALAKRLTGGRLHNVQIGSHGLISKPFQQLLKDFTTEPVIVCNTPCIRFPKEALTLPIVSANPRLLAMLTQELEQQMRLLRGVSLEQRLSDWLSEEPQLTRHEIATRLRVSERTLVRKLHQLGASFQQIRDLARQQLARQLLQKNMAVEKVAHQLGYADASAFIKAYKRWFGGTPRKDRQ